MVEDKEKILGNDALPFSWCYLYELPIKEHVALASPASLKNFDGMLDPEQMLGWMRELASSHCQISELPKLVARIGQHFDEMEDISKEQAEKNASLSGRYSRNKLVAVQHPALRSLSRLLLE